MAVGYFTPDEMATPDDIEYRKKLAQSLMGQGMSTEPIKHWTQGAARLAQALVGAGWQEQARADAKGLREYEAKQLSDLFGGSSVPTAPTPSVAPDVKPAPSQSMTAADATPKADRGGFGNFDSSVNRLFGFEGGLNAKDTNGTPSNMGINQKWNPNVDVTNLTRDQAREIYRNNYWNAIGGDNLPPALAHVAFDTAAMAGPAKAKALMAQAGNDPVKMLELRQQFLDSLVAQNPEKYGPYAKAWANRTEGLRNDVLAYAPSGAQTASAAPVSYAPPLTPIESSPLPAPKAIASALTGAPAPNAGSLVGMGAAPVNAQGFGINAFGGAQPPAQPAPEPRPQQVAQALTGQPAAPAAAPSPVVAPTASSGPSVQKLIGIMGDPRISDKTRQTAMTLYQLSQKDQGFTQVDTGDKVLLLNKQGQVIRELPKSRDAADWEILKDAAGNPIGRFNKRTGVTEREPNVNPSTKINEDIKAREAELVARGLDPKDPSNQRYILTGQMSSPDLSAGDRRAIAEAEDSSIELRNTIDTLRKARELAPQAYTGYTAGLRGSLGTNLPSALNPFDENSAKATREYGLLMSEEAIKNMSASLKGATTDTELREFKNLIADPQLPVDLKVKAIDRMLLKAQRKYELDQQRINQMRGGQYFKQGGGLSNAPANNPSNEGWNEIAPGVRIREKQ